MVKLTASYWRSALWGAGLTTGLFILGAIRVPEIPLASVMSGFIGGPLGGAVGGLLFHSLESWRNHSGLMALFGSWIICTTTASVLFGVVSFMFVGDASMIRYAVLLGLVFGVSFAAFSAFITNRFW